MQSGGPIDADRVGARALDASSHGAQKAGQIADLRLNGGVLDQRSTLGQAGGHQQILRARMARIIQVQARTLEPRGRDDIVYVVSANLCAHHLKTLEVYADWSCANGAAPRVWRSSVAKARQERAHNEKARAHLLSKITRQHRAGDAGGFDPQGIRTLEACRNTQSVQYLHQRADILDVGDVLQQDLISGQQAGCDDWKGSVLGPTDGYLAVERPAALYHDWHRIFPATFTLRLLL